MNRKKSGKIDFSELGPLSQSPFASLGERLGVAPTPAQAQAAPPAAPTKPGRSLLNIRLEKRKKGHQATCIYHLGAEAAQILKQLKSRLGTGGTLGEEAVELQGDHREACRAYLEKEGFKVRVL